MVTASFTQTYGSGRNMLFEVYSNDKRMIELKNLFDINYHSFHNCPDDVIAEYKSRNKVKNTKYLYFTGGREMHYGETIRSLMKTLKEDGVTHFLFTQDDVFSDNNDSVDWTEFMDCVTEQKENFMLNLSYSIDMIKPDLTPHRVRPSFNIYKANSLMFNGVGPWAMDDSCYIATTDIVNKMYDEAYFDRRSVWKCEAHLDSRFKHEEITRYLMEFRMFRTYNIFGKVIAKADERIEDLKQRGLY